MFSGILKAQVDSNKRFLVHHGLTLETSDFDICDLLDELFHMSKKKFSKKNQIVKSYFEVPFHSTLSDGMYNPTLLRGTKRDQRPVESRDSGTVPGLSGILVPNAGIRCPAGFQLRDCPADFCPGPDCSVKLSPGPGPNPGDLRDRDRDPVETRVNRPSLDQTQLTMADGLYEIIR